MASGIAYFARLIVAPALVVLAMAGAANAKSIYVATNGSDSAAGTSTKPYRTITQALKKAATSDKIIVRDGVYAETVRVSKSGTEAIPLEVTAENVGKAIINGSGTAANTDLVVIAANHVRFSGFTVLNATRSGIAVWAATNVTVANNTVSGSQRGGIWAGADGLGWSTRISITGNTVVNNCLENRTRTWSQGWPRAIGVDVSTAVTISGNTVSQNYGEGVGLLSTDGGVISNNVIFDNFSVEVYLDNAPRSTVTGNLIFTTGNAGFYRFDLPAWGVLIANEVTQFQMPSTGINASGNTLIGPDRATYVGPDTYSGTVLTDSVISPNRAFVAVGS